MRILCQDLCIESDRPRKVSFQLFKLYNHLNLNTYQTAWRFYRDFLIISDYLVIKILFVCNWRHSYDFGMVHMVMFSTEHDFRPGSPQYIWLENDLKNVDRTKTPFVIVSGHRPMYCSEYYPGTLSYLIFNSIHPTNWYNLCSQSLGDSRLKCDGLDCKALEEFRTKKAISICFCFEGEDSQLWLQFRAPFTS